MRTPFQCSLHIFRLGKFRTHLFEAIRHYAGSIRLRFLFDGSNFDKPHSLSTPRLICLNYHRAASDGWRMERIVTTVWKIMRIVWVRNEAATIRTLALVEYVYINPNTFIRRFVYNKMVHNLTDFELNSDTTYEQYTYAVESLEVDTENLLPPELPEVRIWYRHNPPHYERIYHRDCPGAGDWHSETCHTFSNVYAAIDSLANEEETFWCHFCHRGLFFPNSCPDPLHVN
jgi:hypothetical protein